MVMDMGGWTDEIAESETWGSVVLQFVLLEIVVLVVVKH